MPTFCWAKACHTNDFRFNGTAERTSLNLGKGPSGMKCAPSKVGCGGGKMAWSKQGQKSGKSAQAANAVHGS